MPLPEPRISEAYKKYKISHEDKMAVQKTKLRSQTAVITKSDNSYQSMKLNFELQENADQIGQIIE